MTLSYVAKSHGAGLKASYIALPITLSVTLAFLALVDAAGRFVGA
jgi:hypothetical protein